MLGNTGSTGAQGRILDNSNVAQDLLRECQSLNLLPNDQVDQLNTLVRSLSKPAIHVDLIVRSLDIASPNRFGCMQTMIVRGEGRDDWYRLQTPMEFENLKPFGQNPVVWIADFDGVAAAEIVNLVRKAKLVFGSRNVMVYINESNAGGVEFPKEWLVQPVPDLPNNLPDLIALLNGSATDFLKAIPSDQKQKVMATDGVAIDSVVVFLTQLLQDRRRILSVRLAAMTGELETVEASRGESNAGRAAADSLRSAVDAKADELMGHAQAELADWLGTRGKLNRAVLTHVEQLSDGDFETDEAYSRLVRRLSPRVTAEIKIKFQQNSKELFRATAKASREAIASLEADFFARCKSLGFERLGYVAPPADEDRAWNAIKAQVEVPVDFKFEQQKRGFLQRLGEGKHMLSTAMMTLSLLGMMAGFQWRKNTEILYALPLVFLAGIGYSFYSWKHQDHEYVAKELDRIRESMTRDLNRTLQDSEKAILVYLRSTITTAVKSLQQFSDQAMRDSAAQQVEDTVARRGRLKDQTKRLETELRGLDQSLQRSRPLR